MNTIVIHAFVSDQIFKNVPYLTVHMDHVNMVQLKTKMIVQHVTVYYQLIMQQKSIVQQLSHVLHAILVESIKKKLFSSFLLLFFMKIGYIKDADGCETCQCKLRGSVPCLPVSSECRCDYGSYLNVDGCETCSCLPDPKEASR